MVKAEPKKKKAYQLVKGMKDILPEDQRYWDYIKHVVSTMADIYGFKRIETPVLEFVDLFNKGIGQATDVVEKEMYNFVDQGEDHLALRPEVTAGVVRAYIEHGMLNLTQPVKLFYISPCFRREKPQGGRYRQFYQFGFEVLGEADAVVDAQIISITYKLYRSLNLPISVQINSVGCPDCRPAYLTQLKEYFKRYKGKLSEASVARLAKNPLRILDSKEKEDLPLIVDAPQQVDFLCENCKNHFIQVLEYLEELEIPYVLNPSIVRGLDYYSRTTFEIWVGEEEGGRQSALGGGGRYDGLVAMLGGQETPAVGFAGGVERLVSQIRDRDFKVPEATKPKVFLAQLGGEAKKKTLSIFEKLNEAGIKVYENFGKGGLKAQLEQADKLGVHFTLIIGQKEIIDKTIMIRDMENGNQEVVDISKIIPEIKKRLERSVVNEEQV